LSLPLLTSLSSRNSPGSSFPQVPAHTKNRQFY
jgi:hypothetical protein